MPIPLPCLFGGGKAETAVVTICLLETLTTIQARTRTPTNMPELREIQDMMRRVSRMNRVTRSFFLLPPHSTSSSLVVVSVIMLHASDFVHTLQARAILPAPGAQQPAPFCLQWHLEHARRRDAPTPPLVGQQILPTVPPVIGLTQDSIQAYGKSLLLVLQPPVRLGAPTTFIRIQFYLHGHMLVISEEEMLEIEQYWSRWPAEVRGEYHPHISLCVRSCNGESVPQLLIS